MATQGKQRPVRLGSVAWSGRTLEKRKKSARLIAANLQRIEFDSQKEKMMASEPGRLRVTFFNPDQTHSATEWFASYDSWHEASWTYLDFPTHDGAEDRAVMGMIADAALRALAE